MEFHIPANVDAYLAANTVSSIVVTAMVCPTAVMPMIVAALAVTTVVTVVVAVLVSAPALAVVAITPEVAKALAVTMTAAPATVITVRLFDEVFLSADSGSVRNACGLGIAADDNRAKTQCGYRQQCFERLHVPSPHEI